jgi:UDP-N-acetylmuramoyl-L-alanyl-D-glutamate--2,6-diaminopimelate ligase
MMKKIIRSIVPAPQLRFLLRIYHFKLALIGALIYGFPSQKLFVVAVTGTKGKTSTIEFVNAILEHAGVKTAIASTLHFKIGERDERNLFKMTMPGRFFLQKFLRNAVRAGCTHAIIEMTSEGAAQYRHKFIYLDALIFTNLTPEHIESHGSYENYVAAKLFIARALSRSPKQNKFLLANTDSKEADKFLATPNVTAIPFSINDARDITEGSEGISFVWEGEKITSHFPGTFNTYNMVGAATFAHRVLNIAPRVAAQALSTFPGIRGRMERVAIVTEQNEVFPPFLVVVDYAHTEDSLRKAYEALPHNPKVCVLGGTGGGRDKWKRPLMGGVAVEYCKHIILTNEDPYDEDPAEIVNDIKRGIDTANKDRAKNGNKTVPCEIIMDRRRAIAVACAQAHEGDAVIITGKGTDPFIMGPAGTKIPWDDAQVAREELTELLRTRGAHFKPFK